MKIKRKAGENYKKPGELFRTTNKEELEEVTEGAAVTIRKSKAAVPSLERITEAVI